MTLTKAGLVEQLQSNLRVTYRESTSLIETLLDEIKMALARGQVVKIKNFGSWMPKGKNQRVGRNPSTGEKMTLPGRVVVTFRPAPKLRSRIDPET